MHDYAVRGQYGPGTIDGKPVPGYRQEPNVAPDSATPTYCAIRFMIDNWRWQGIPFYLRSGKRMPRRASEIAIQFRQPPHVMFPLPEGQTIESNILAIRVQPEEGIALRFEVKVPGIEVKMASVDMDFRYAEAFGELEHDAYETLLLDCMLGEATLFTRSDEVEAAWGWSIPCSTSGPTSGPTTSPTTRRAPGGRPWPTSSSPGRAPSGGSRSRAGRRARAAWRGPCLPGGAPPLR